MLLWKTWQRTAIIFRKSCLSFFNRQSHNILYCTFWNIDSRPILQNGMSSILLAVVVPLLCLRLSGAILMLMTITTIMMITREKLVSILTICCSNLSFLARHRPAEPCPLCSTKHNAICHRLFCKICYLDNPCIFCAYTTIFLVTVFKAQHCLLIHLYDIPLTLNTSLKAKKPNFGSSFIFFLSKMNWLHFKRALCIINL